MTALLPPSPLLSSSELKLSRWALRLCDRFPTWVDMRLLKALRVILGATSLSFFDKRAPLHLKKLLLIHFLLQKKLEAALKEKKEPKLLVRIFSINSRLSIIIAHSKAETTLTQKTIFEVASQNVAALKKIALSSYQWTSSELPYSISYIELEKMRGKELSRPAIKALEIHLQKGLYKHLLGPSIFWPYNHEEAFKQLLTLEKEVSHSKDYPQVSLYFHKQSSEHIEFLIYLVRPKKRLSSATTITPGRFPPSVQLIYHLKKELNAKIPTLAENFSLLFPRKDFEENHTINLLHVREFTAKLLQNVIGLFRDYNGGLFETQKSRFEQLAKTFSKTVANFSLFGEELFYSLNPIEAQVCLDTALFEHLFKGVSQSLSNPTPFLSQPSPYVIILKVRHFTELASHLDRIKELEQQNKITAYASFEILSDHYLCLLDKSGKHLDKSQIEHYLTPPPFKSSKTLRLHLEIEDIPPLIPDYLSREIRGRIIANLLFEGLFRLDPNGQITQANCASLTLSKDKKRYLFKLRTSHWSNGEKVTAFHYEESWRKNILKETDLDLFYTMKTTSTKKLSIKALDEDHLQVDLAHEDPTFLEKLTYPCFAPYLHSKAFNGPYTVLRKDEQQLSLKKNVFYWDAKKIFFDGIELSFKCPLDAIRKLFQNGQTDWFGTPFCFGKNNPSNSYKEKEIFLPFLIYFNTEYLPLSSPFIRLALSHAIDRRAIASKIFKSAPLFSLLPGSSSKYELRQAEALFEKGLKELKLTRNTFPPLKISSLSLASHEELAHCLKKVWQTTFQIQVDLDFQQCNHFYRSMEQGKFHIGGFFKDAFPTDPTPFFNSFSCKKTNYSRWSCQEYTKMVELLKKASPEEKRELAKKTENLLLSYAPVTPLATYSHHYNHHPNLQDYVLLQNGSIDFRFASLKAK